MITPPVNAAKGVAARARYTSSANTRLMTSAVLVVPLQSGPFGAVVQ